MNTKQEAINLADEESLTGFCPVINDMCKGYKCVCWDLRHTAADFKDNDQPDMFVIGLCRHNDINRDLTEMHGYYVE